MHEILENCGIFCEILENYVKFWEIGIFCKILRYSAKFWEIMAGLMGGARQVMVNFELKEH